MTNGVTSTRTPATAVSTPPAGPVLTGQHNLQDGQTDSGAGQDGREHEESPQT
jgi:hypothetical protein